MIFPRMKGSSLSEMRWCKLKRANVGEMSRKSESETAKFVMKYWVADFFEDEQNVTSITNKLAQMPTTASVVHITVVVIRYFGSSWMKYDEVGENSLVSFSKPTLACDVIFANSGRLSTLNVSSISLSDIR